jgi:sensor histidine kinase YesM
MFGNFMDKNHTIHWALVSASRNLIATNIDSSLSHLMENRQDSFLEAFTARLPDMLRTSPSIHEYPIGENNFLVRQNTVGNTGWTLLGLTDAKLLNEAVDHLNMLIAVSGIVSLVLLATLISMIVQNFTKAVTHMAKTVADSPSPLDLDLRKELRRNDEIGILAQSLDNQTKRIKTLITQQEELAQQRRLLEIRMLQGQIHPHFLGNTLACIESLLKEGQYEEVQLALRALTKLMHYSISRTEGMVSLRDELACTKAYVDLREMRSQDGFDYTVLVPPKYQGHPVPKLILQPVIENAIVHGFADIPHRGQIVLIAYELNGKLYLGIDDNGSGISHQRLRLLLSGKLPASTHSQGIGLSNVFSRLHLNYSDSSESTIQRKSDGGTRVILDLGTFVPKRPLASSPLSSQTLGTVDQTDAPFQQCVKQSIRYRPSSTV